MKETIVELVKISEEQDSFAAIRKVNAMDDALKAAEIYFHFSKVWFWEKKDVATMNRIGAAGIQYCMDQAAKEKDAELSNKLLSYAKSISFNMAVNNWPAWEEEGIVITKSDLVQGLDFAKLNLRLALELKKGAEPEANAHWALAAHYIIIKKYKLAVEHLEISIKKSQEAKKTDGEWMARGYIGIIERLQDENNTETFDKAVAELIKINTDDSKFLADQLKSVLKYFQKAK